MSTNLQIRAQSAPWRNGIELYIGDPDGKTKVSNIILERTEDAVISTPSFTLTIQQAQVLMDDLWHSGIRPTEGSGSAGALKATQSHLDDMRKIAFKGLGI